MIGGATLLVVRHAAAGDRAAWEGDDELRPLTKKGRHQAAGLVDLLAGFEVERIRSSPYVRCLETVVYLACVRRLSIESDEALAEGNSHRLLDALPGYTGTLVLCTHGDILYDLLSLTIGRPDDSPMAKGSTWVIETAAGGQGLSAARYLAPPA